MLMLRRSRIACLAATLAALTLIAACDDGGQGPRVSAPTATLTVRPTATAPPTATATATTTATTAPTSTATATSTASRTPTFTPTVTPTLTPTQSPADTATASPTNTQTPTVFQANLGGQNEASPVDTLASATASMVLDGQGTHLVVTLTTQGLTLADVIAAHIHVGPPGVDGPVVLTLYNMQTDGPFTSPFTTTMSSENLQPVEGIQTFADAMQALRTGNAYVNIHTVAHPGGEMRGQVGATELQAQLAGQNEASPVETNATGRANLALTSTTITVTIHTENLTDAVLAHIHLGPPGVDGPVIFTLYNSQTDGAFSSPFTVTVSAAELQPIDGAMTFAEAVAAIKGGNAYVNVHTVAHPGGEIRGQVGGSNSGT